MKVFRYLAAATIITALFALEAASKKVTFCYWGTWSHYRQGDGQFRVENIDPNLCTHIGYSFFGLGDNNEIKSLDSWLDYDLKNIEKTVALKQVNSNLKVMASIGGWNEGSTKYSIMAADANKRSVFIDSVMKFIAQHGFDGLDLDWEYPGQRGGTSSDRSNFVLLLKELNSALKQRGLLLTVAVAASSTSVDISYDIINFSQHVDLINVMTYDFAGSWDTKTGFNAPLQGEGGNTVQAAIQYWLEKGAPSNKIVIGLPAYGRSFTLSNANDNAPGASASGAGIPGPITKEPGYLGFNEICVNLKSGWKSVFDTPHQVPYAYHENQWVGYDNPESIVMKVNFLNSLNLAGAMVWSIETDDFAGHCGERYPILNSIQRALNHDLQPSTTSAPKESSTQISSSSIKTTRPPTNAPPDNSKCQNVDDAMFVHPSDCTRFYRCVNGIRYDFQCPNGLHFDQVNLMCNWPSEASCNL